MEYDVVIVGKGVHGVVAGVAAVNGAQPTLLQW